MRRGTYQRSLLAAELGVPIVADGMDGKGRDGGLGTVLGKEHYLIDLDAELIYDLLVDVVGEKMLFPDGDHGYVAQTFNEASFELSLYDEISLFEQPVSDVYTSNVLSTAYKKPHGRPETVLRE
jgi:hypothetical protein